MIDADIRAPFQHYAFPVPKVDGLLGYLQGTTEFVSTIMPTPVPGLSLMPSGGTSNRAPEYLASTKNGPVDRIRVKRSAAYQYIIIDTPPALLVPDAQILARAGDGTIIVTAADSTARAATTKTFLMFDPDDSVRRGAEPVQAFVFDRAQRALWPLWTVRPLRALREILEVFEIRGS